MAELVCLNCPKEYWIAFALESQGGEASDGFELDGRMPAGIGPEWYEFFPASLDARNSRPLTMLRNVVWLNTQGSTINDVSIDYFLCPDIEAHVNLREESPYQKVLP